MSSTFERQGAAGEVDGPFKYQLEEQVAAQRQDELGVARYPDDKPVAAFLFEEDRKLFVSAIAGTPASDDESAQSRGKGAKLSALARALKVAMDAEDKKTVREVLAEIAKL